MIFDSTVADSLDELSENIVVYCKAGVKVSMHRVLLELGYKVQSRGGMLRWNSESMPLITTLFHAQNTLDWRF